MTERRYINQKSGEVVDDVQPRKFTDILAEMGEGTTDSELSEAMYDLVQRVQETGKAGSLQLTIIVGFDGQGRVQTKDAIKKKFPEFNRPTTAFFMDKEGNVSRRDPNQPTIPGVTNITDKREAN